MKDYYSGLREKLVRAIVAERVNEYRGLPGTAKQAEDEIYINQVKMAVDTMASFIIYLVQNHNDEYGIKPYDNLRINP